jgi:hypothetical protein
MFTLNTLGKYPDIAKELMSLERYKVSLQWIERQLIAGISEV